nr:esterase-like activity of phytase family protein [Tatlockia sp.]
MTTTKHWLSLLSCSLLVSALGVAGSAPSAFSISLTNTLTIDGNSTDLYPFAGNSANVNRLGGFFSDLYYDRYNNVYYGLPDRGPGGGLISYETRVQKFSLDVEATTGAISNFNLLDTVLLTNGSDSYNGLNPTLLNGNPGVLGLSLDPEGFAVAPNGNFYISDEYGPSVYEFTASGSFLRSLATPSNILPVAGSVPNYVDGRPTLTEGRQDNRGFEGLTLSPDGSKLYTVLQDPLVNEGSPDGRRSPNLRIVEYDTVKGESIAQYIYTLESLAHINARIPGTEDDFGSNSQGRNIGVSSITALNNSEFLVIERDNRGVGETDPTGIAPVSSKRVYKIDLSQATDVSSIDLSGTNTLPNGVTAVSKSLFLDIADSLQAVGQVVPEKLEGLTIGPQLTDGSYAVLIGTDNDFSVTQTGEGVQADVCTDDTTVAINAGCPEGATLIPSYLYSFKASSSELQGFVP